MARLEIEERAWSDSKLKYLVVELGSTRAYAMGLLAILWHDSQNENKTHATERELSVWFAEDIAAGIDPIRILVASGYLEKTTDGRYRIDGNKPRLAKVAAYKSRAKLANDARWSGVKKARNRAKAQAVSQDAIRILVVSNNLLHKDSPQHTTNNIQQTADSILKNAEKFTQSAYASAEPVRILNSEDGKVIRPTSGSRAPWDDEPEPKARSVGASAPRHRAKGPKSETGAHLVVAAYLRAYKSKFGGQDADLVGSELGAAKRLAIDLGPERAVRIVEAYLQMDDSWFHRQEYRLAVLLQNVKKVALFADKGIAMNDQIAKSIGLAANNKAVGERVLDAIRAKEGKVNG